MDMKATPMTSHDKRNEAGFSLIELMIAMTVTLIVCGAIYGLISGAKNAFRREPELSDRQQNTRIAMSLIEQDVQAAGIGLPPFVQAFAPTVNGASVDGFGPNGEDVLEIIVGLPGCPLTDVCLGPGVVGANIVFDTNLDLPACFGLPAGGGPVLGAVTYGGGATGDYVVGPVINNGNPGAGACAVAANTYGVQLSLQWNGGPAGWRRFGAGVPPAGVPTAVIPVQVVRYTVATDPNDPSAPNDPNFRHLWRSVSGARSAADGWADDDEVPPGPTWQLVARGINDLQVTYVDGDGLRDVPQVFAAAADWNRIVRQVNVTLSSRVAQAMIAGFTGTDMTDPTQIRLGQLVSQIAPRAGLIALQNAPADPFRWK
jgi:prepilin-type N-terminal cleavage/methylation domain-containing protein